MNKKRIIAVSAGLLVLIFLVLPGLLGSHIEKQTVAYFENLYKTTSSQNLEVTYDKGWFSSTLTITVEYPENYKRLILLTLPEEDQDTNITLALRVDHGPIILRGFKFGLARFSGENSFFGSPPENLKSPFDQIPLFEMDGVIGFDGSATTLFKVPAFDLVVDSSLNPEMVAGNESKISLDEIHIEIGAREEDGFLRITLKLLDLRMAISSPTINTMEFKIAGLEGDSYYRIGAPYPINYDHGMVSLRRMLVAMDEKIFSMEDMESRDLMSRSENSPLLDYTSQFQMGAIGFHEAGDEDQEPQVISTQAEIEILHIDSEAVLELVEFLNTRSEPMSDSDVEQILGITQKLLAAQPEYNYQNMNVVTRWGIINYSHRLIFPAVEVSANFDREAFATKIFYSGNLFFAEDFVGAMVEIFIEKQLAAAGQQVDDETFETIKGNTIQQFITAGYLVSEEGGYSMAIELKDGVLTINGTPHDLLGLLQSQI